MIKSIKQTIALVLTVVVLFAVMPSNGFDAFATEAIYSGTCGENLTWSLDVDSGELVISGTGDMDFGLEDIVPWDEYKDKIVEVTVANGVTSVDSYSFADCLNLSKVLFPESLTKISSSAFVNCINLFDINLPENIIDIGFYAFYNTGYYNTTSNWSDGVLYIQNYLIKANEAIEGKYVIKAGTKILADYAFDNCTHITQVVFPDSVTRIGKYVFIYCNNLTNVDLGRGLKYIGTASFDICEKLKSILIPASVICIEIAEDSTNFCRCSALETFMVESGNKYYSSDSYGVLFDKNQTTLIKYPEGSGNVSYKIPESVTSVEDAAFDNCSNLTSVYIPKSVTYIGNCSFMTCDALKDVYYGGTKQEWNAMSIHYYNGALFNATINFLGEVEHKHELAHRTIESNCKVAGMEYDICLECGESFNVVILPLSDHSWSVWSVTKEATAEDEGEEQRSCSVCGKIETRVIPKLNKIKDENTGIEIVYSDEYDIDVEIEVEPIYDGNSYQIIETTYGNVNSKIFDITTVKDGVKVQPDGTVKVRIPVPADFISNTIFVCYVDSVSGTVENIPAVVKDGYVEFEAEHFSHYAVVEKLGKINFVDIGNISMDYKASTTITPAINVDSGVEYTVTYSSSDNSVVAVDENGKLTATGTGSATITCTVTDEHGNVVTDTCEVEVSYNWWQWIIVILLFGWIWY